jgi:hypothetical protein
LKIKQILEITMAMVIGSSILVACGNGSKSEKNSVNNTKSDLVHSQKKSSKKITYKKEKAIIQLINKQKPKFKLWFDGEYTDVVKTALSEEKTTANEDPITYGFDNPYKGTSTDAFAVKNGMNKDKARFIYNIISHTGSEEHGYLSLIADSILDPSSKKEGTVANASLVQEKKDKLIMETIEIYDLAIKDSKKNVITGTANIHYKFDGQEKNKILKINEYGSNIPLKKDNKFTVADKKLILHSKKMNVNLPNIDDIELEKVNLTSDR